MANSNCKPETLSIQADIIPFPISEEILKRRIYKSNNQKISGATEENDKICRILIESNIADLRRYIDNGVKPSTILFGLTGLVRKIGGVHG